MTQLVSTARKVQAVVDVVFRKGEPAISEIRRYLRGPNLYVSHLKCGGLKLTLNLIHVPPFL